MSFNKTAILTIDDEHKVFLRVSFLENDDAPDEFRIEVRRTQHADVVGEGSWHVRERDGQFSLQVSAQTIAGGICLAGCFADVVTGPLADCLRHARTRAQVRKCIEEHGFFQAVKSLVCVYGCLGQ